MQTVSISSRGLLFLLILLLTAVWTQGASGQRVRFSRGDRDLVLSKLSRLENPVAVHLYTGSGNAAKTQRTLALLELMQEYSGKISVIKHDMEKDPSLKSDLGVDHGPVMALKGETFQGISYYGLPSQMELEPFLDGILIAAGNGKRLSPQADAFLSKLEKEVHIRVFVTPD